MLSFVCLLVPLVSTYLHAHRMWPTTKVCFHIQLYIFLSIFLLSAPSFSPLISSGQIFRILYLYLSSNELWLPRHPGFLGCCVKAARSPSTNPLPRNGWSTNMSTSIATKLMRRKLTLTHVLSSNATMLPIGKRALCAFTFKFHVPVMTAWTKLPSPKKQLNSHPRS